MFTVPLKPSFSDWDPPAELSFGSLRTGSLAFALRFVPEAAAFCRVAAVYLFLSCNDVVRVEGSGSDPEATRVTAHSHRRYRSFKFLSYADIINVADIHQETAPCWAGGGETPSFLT